MKILKIFEENTKGRDFVVGDIHGHYDLFMAELNKLEFDREVDRMFSVGDLIDRGPKSLECLELLSEPWFFAVCGNHEDFMFECILGKSLTGSDYWGPNGGDWHKEIDPYEMELIAQSAYDKMSVAIQINNPGNIIGITHAAPPLEIWNEEHIANMWEQALWDRGIIKHYYTVPNPVGVDSTYHGHTPTNGIYMKGKATWIDTGAYRTGNLTILEI